MHSMTSVPNASFAAPARALRTMAARFFEIRIA
jgi:hypothetical protein